MMELFPEGVRGGRPAGRRRARRVHGRRRPRNGCGRSSAARAARTSRAAGRTSGAPSTGRYASGGSGRPALGEAAGRCARSGRRTRAAPSARARIRRRSSASRRSRSSSPPRSSTSAAARVVLAIAAARLGFAPVLAVDIEEPSIEATSDNARANGAAVEARLIGADERLPGASVTVANISLESVEALPPRIDTGTLLTSGYFALRGAAPPRLRARPAAAPSTGGPPTCPQHREALGFRAWRRSASISSAARFPTPTCTRCARFCCATATVRSSPRPAAPTSQSSAPVA